MPKNHTHHRALNAKPGDNQNKFTLRSAGVSVSGKAKHNHDDDGDNKRSGTVGAALKYSASAAKDFNVHQKHVRREFEPSDKTAGEKMLTVPWCDLPKGSLSQHALFALHEVMHMSHATHVQQTVIPFFSLNEVAPSSGDAETDYAKPTAAANTKQSNINNNNNNNNNPRSRSCVVEAPTGSGKTLAFVVPVVERLLRQNERYVARTGRPHLSRNICSFIVAPSRVLAQQTFIVARNYSCRYPFSIKFLLVDRTVEPLETTAARLLRVARCGGLVAVGTIGDIAALNDRLVEIARQGGAAAVLAGIPDGFENDNDNEKQQGEGGDDADDDDQDDHQYGDDDDDDDGFDPEERRRRIAILKARAAAAKSKSTAASQQQRQQQKSSAAFANNSNNNDDGNPPQFAPFNNGLDGDRFMCIVDEADVVLRDAASFNKLLDMFERIKSKFGSASSFAVSAATVASASAAGGSKKQKAKSAAVADASTTTTALAASPQGIVDFGLFGATATSASEVARFMADMQSRGYSAGTQLETFTLSPLESDIDSDLRNVYDMVPPKDMLQSLVHILNAHPSKKHFIFFNHVAVLSFVHRVLLALSKGSVRPVLRTSAIYVLHEGMKDQARFDQFGAFVRHGAATSTIGNNKFTANDATGAILLCTDEAAFGLDVRDVDYVVHFEAPTTLQRFVHRSGRVARMGMRGTSLMILPENERAKKFVQQVKERFILHPLYQHHSDSAAGAAGSAASSSHYNNNNMNSNNHYNAPISAIISSHAEEIASGAAEIEMQKASATIGQVMQMLPARRSRTFEEKLASANTPGIAMTAVVVAPGAGLALVNAESAINAVGAIGNQHHNNHHHGPTSLSGPRLLAAAAHALASPSTACGDEATNDEAMFTPEEALSALTARN